MKLIIQSLLDPVQLLNNVIELGHRLLIRLCTTKWLDIVHCLGCVYGIEELSVVSTVVRNGNWLIFL
jgi:hypothetical protein